VTTVQAEPATRVPIVLPCVEIEVTGDGSLGVTLDNEPYDVPGDWSRLGRAAVGRIVDDITTRLGCPVRVEVTETDGSSFTDIAMPGEQTPSVGSSMVRDTVSSSAYQVAGDGFVPDEQVAVAVVVAHQTARADGTARLRLPPALLAGRPGGVVLLGRLSGTVAVSDGVG
jgi:hypothetical protein